jgi:poly-gamma-glutamate synthesis protein (capsule biosynthesis protein)
MRTGYDIVGATETNVADGFALVAVGDAIVTRPLTRLRDPGFDALVKILRNADVTFGYMETNIFDLKTFTGAPQAEYGGAFHVSVPELGPDLRAMGFNLMARANNHALDWGVEGMRETTRALDANSIIHAGVGENRAQAGAARYFDTAKGRVALVSYATTYAPLARAEAPAAEAPGRPGLNGLRLTQRALVTREMLDNLRKVRDWLRGPTPSRTADNPDEVVIGTTRYKVGDRPGYSFQPNQRDVKDILRNVRQGKQFSDFLIITAHSHEPGNRSQEPPDYLQSFAHKAIDTGADAFIVHGPHQLRGIEIYKGRPIFYSVGNFIMDDLRTPVGYDMYEAHGKDPDVDTDADVTVHEMASGFSEEVWYESIIAVSRYERNQLAEIRIYPIELDHGNRFADRGIPRPAPAALAKTILERLQRLSRPFGTNIVVEENVGVIRVPPTATSLQQ